MTDVHTSAPLMPLCSSSIWQMLVSHVCLHQCSLLGSWTQSIPADLGSLSVIDKHARASRRRCGERLRYSGNAAQLVFCLHNSDSFIPPWNTPSGFMFVWSVCVAFRSRDAKTAFVRDFSSCKETTAIFCLSLLIPNGGGDLLRSQYWRTQGNNRVMKRTCKLDSKDLRWTQTQKLYAVAD